MSLARVDSSSTVRSSARFAAAVRADDPMIARARGDEHDETDSAHALPMRGLSSPTALSGVSTSM